MKTTEELNAIKEEVKALNKKLNELTEDELKQVVGGSDIDFRKDLYENVIIGVSPEDHNVMLNTAKDKEGDI